MTDPIEQLIRLAGRRDSLPPDRMQRLKETARAEWRAETSARTRRRTVTWLVGAAAAAALLTLAVRFGPGASTDIAPVRLDIATVEQVRGTVQLAPPPGVDGVSRSGTPGAQLRAGDTLDTTTGGRAAIRLVSGPAVLIDAGTRVTWVSEHVITLEQGAVYVDSGSGSATTPLEVRTPLGVARDIGTRFEVRLDPDRLRIRVRDGLVRVNRRQQTLDVTPGNEASLDTDGRITRRAITASDAAWGWARLLTAPFRLEGRSLRDFLTWVVDETGWQLQYARARDAETARTLTLHGSIDDLSPEQAIDAVLPASGVEHVRRGDALIIQRITGSPR